jgi:hypothetical protein
MASVLIAFGERVDVSIGAGAAIIEATRDDPHLMLGWVAYSLVLQIVATKTLNLRNTTNAVYVYLYAIGTAALAFGCIVLSLKLGDSFAVLHTTWALPALVLLLGPFVMWSFFGVPTFLLARAYGASNELAVGLLLSFATLIVYSIGG